MGVLAVVGVGFACAVACRRWPPVRDALSVAASTILCVLGATIGGGLVLTLGAPPASRVVALVVAAVVALLAAWGGARVNRAVRAELAARGVLGRERPDAFDRIEGWAGEHPLRVGRYDLTVLGVRVWRRAVEVRVTGLAAEMTYYALISLVPLVVAFGSTLGYLERILGADQVAEIENTVVGSLTDVFAEQVTADVLAPLIENLLRQERTGLALGSVAVVLWLASRVFRAAIRALDDAYAVRDRRGLVSQGVLGVALALGSVITVAVVVALVVVGPLLGGGVQLADDLGLGSAFATLWTWARWPLVALATAIALTIVYRYAPNVSHTWRDCLPGAVLGTAAVVLVAIGFQVYLGAAGPGRVAAAAGRGEAAVVAAGQVVAAILAGVLWVWLTSIVVLVGGVLNAEVRRMRGDDPRMSDPAATPEG